VGFARGFCPWVLPVGFAREFCPWVLPVSFICEFSSMGFHLWIFHSSGVCERNMRAKYADEVFFDETSIIRIFFCNAKLVYIII
jgi:hypothetical protein